MVGIEEKGHFLPYKPMGHVYECIFIYGDFASVFYFICICDIQEAQELLC